jgi:CRISPR-associated protein Cas5d
MTNNKRFGVAIHVFGNLACFTRPEMKVERVSYDVITPSAARGIVEAIYWKPEIRWIIDRLHVLKPIRFSSMRRNEVGGKISARTAETAMRAGHGNIGLYVEDERQQRAALLLRDVAYVIEAHFEIIAGEVNEGKHLDQFNRRARDGQCYTRPYLGCRELAADFELVEHSAALPPVDASLKGTRDLGWMLHDIDFKNGRQPHFFHAVMKDGVIDVPPFDSPEIRR